VIERSFMITRVAAIEHDAVAWFAGPGLMNTLLQFRWMIPALEGQAPAAGFGIPWRNWFLGIDPREEPPQAIQQQLEYYSQLRATAGEAEQIRLAQQIVDIAAEEFYTFGISWPELNHGIVKNNFRNVPESMLDGDWMFIIPVATNPQQYFIEGGGRQRLKAGGACRH
jgi:peptide/nickel transport system substrate-binding protein